MSDLILDAALSSVNEYRIAAREARRNATYDELIEGMVNPTLPRRVSIGDSCKSGCDFLQPERWEVEYLDLYYDIDAQSVLTTAGNAAFAVTMAPVNPWFVPVAIAVTVNDATDMDLDRRAFFTALTVDGCRQLDINNATPTMATTQLIPSDKWDPRARNGCACPIVMAPYTNTGIGSALAVLSGINRNPVGISIMVTVNFYGKMYSSCPKWLEEVDDKHKRPSKPSCPIPPAPPAAGNGTFTSGGRGRPPAFPPAG